MTKQYQISDSTPSGHFKILSGLYFLSGTTGLILQVVWMYRLGLVFGNAAYATSATLAAFFLGIALGGWVFGKASTRFVHPLTAYGLMEVGIALTALLWIPGIEFYQTHYPSVVDFLDGDQSMLTLMKFIFSSTLLLIPTILMGGTFPILAQYVVKGQNQLASRGTILYSMNTLGASLGAFLAGFYLLMEFGVRSTYSFALILAIVIGIAAILLDRLPVGRIPRQVLLIKDEPVLEPTQSSSSYLVLGLNHSQFIMIAFSSGLLALSAETIWTRMFAQVLQNSVYSFSAILVVFLIALGFGGVLSHILVRLALRPISVLLALLIISAIAIAFSPFVFSISTNGLDYVFASESWFDYLKSVFGLCFIVVFPPTVVLGAIFPFLLKATSKFNQHPGGFVGKLVLFNSLGGTLGPILAGFVFLDLVGLWNSIKIVSVLYVILALLVTFSFFNHKNYRWMVMPLLLVIVVLTITNPPIVKLESGHKILDTWQSSDGVVSIVESSENIQMRLDNYYVLGDSRSILVEQMQAHIPLLIHPSPKNTLFLGMGTGITAGASLNHNVECVVVVELVSNVIPAAKEYFSPWVNGLFDDTRVEIISDDARNFLLGTSEQFDVIVGDLFTPWHAGTGSLYTIEHFRQAKERLAPDGIFAQWLPLYQLTPESFETISATFASLFSQVSLWRADFSGMGASIVLIGQEAGTQLDQEILQRNIINVVGKRDSSSRKAANHMAGLFYLGDLDALQIRTSETTLNTDDKRSVEFNAPISSQQVSTGGNTYIVGKELESLLMTLASNLPAEQDPYLSNLPPDEILYVKVGLLYFQYLQLINAGKVSEANNLLERIHLLSPDFLSKL